jgi:hypothetical protein
VAILDPMVEMASGVRQAPSAVAHMGRSRPGSNDRVSRDARNARKLRKLTESYTGGGTTGPAHVDATAGALREGHGVYHIGAEPGISRGGGIIGGGYQGEGAAFTNIFPTHGAPKEDAESCVRKFPMPMPVWAWDGSGEGGGHC